MLRVERRGAKPGERRGGRAKGTPNKFTKELRNMILGALDKAGGESYLKRQADENPCAFMALLGKVLPTTLRGDPDAPVVTFLELLKTLPEPNDGDGSGRRG